MKEKDLHYLAGIVDADGSIFVNTRKTERARYGFYIAPKLTIVGVDKEDYQERHRLLRELAKELDADIGSEIHPTDGSKKTTIQGSTCIRVLEALFPYLREKKPQADRILQEEWDGNQFGRNGRPPESYQSLVECREEIHEYMSSAGRRKYDREQLLSELDGEAST